MSIGIGTLFAFIVVISAIWCVSTYYDFKMQEAEAASMNTESNIGSYMYDDNSNHQNTIIVPDILSYPECRISVPRRMYECYPLSTTSPEQLSHALFPPPPYSEVGDPATSNSSRYLVAIKISIFVTFFLLPFAYN